MAEIEMLDIESNTTPTSYLTKILEFSKQSTPENSIVFDFEVDANYCHCKATRYDIDGSKQEIKEEKINLVTVTRLVKQKGIDRLIKVHSKLIKQGLNHEIFVIGDGPEKENLENQIKEEKVENTFHLLGAKQNPYPYMKKANYFCLLSYFEGYGMVLEEAKILNKKIIITDTAGREAVNGYNKAIILENEEEKIYQGLEKIIKSDLEKNETIDKSEKQEEFIYNNSNIINEIQKLVGE